MQCVSDRVKIAKPEGQGFGAPWVAAPKTLLAQGSFVRSILTPHGGRVAFDLNGRWNKTPLEETISVIVHPDVAEDLGRILLEAAKAARRDGEQIRRD